jgi:hypothetical protein
MGTCISNNGYRAAERIRFLAAQTAATYRQSLAVVEFALNAYDAVKNYRKLSDISSRGIAVEEAQQGHLQNTYWPREKQFLDEYVQPTAWESQPVLAKRYAGRMWAPIAAAFAQKLGDLQCSKPRYCGNAYFKAMQELLVSRGLAKANVEALSDRIAFAEVQAINDTDVERRKAAIAMRQGLIGQAAALMRSAAGGLAEAGAEAMSAANNALQTFAYEGQRANRPDPMFHARAAGRAMATNMVPVETRNLNDWSTRGGDGNSVSGMDQVFTGDTDGGLQYMAGEDGYGLDSSLTSDAGNYSNFNSWNASNVNDIQGIVQGGESRDLARSGRITISNLLDSRGDRLQTFSIDLGEADLAAVDGYKSDREQTGPGFLPGGGGPNVSYGVA